MTRYTTRWYVTTNLDDVQRLAGLDHTPEGEIKTTPNVEPLHVGKNLELLVRQPSD